MHIEKNIGTEVQIKLFKPTNNSKLHIGILKDFNDGEIILEIDNNEMVLDRKNISQIKTIYKW